jgi:hypothetical protein
MASASSLMSSAVHWLESAVGGWLAPLLRPAGGTDGAECWMMAFLPAEVPGCGESVPSRHGGAAECAGTNTSE